MEKLVFGPAGIPIRAKGKGIVQGVFTAKELGMEAMEIEFVHGVWMNEGSAKKVSGAREKTGLVLTAHAPYYVNLNSKDPEKVDASRKRILRTARMADLCGGYSITFHAAYISGMEREAVYQKAKKELAQVIQEAKDAGIKLWIRPELTGKPNQLGDLDEVIRLSQELDQVLPCIDFSHMHARTNGKWNSYSEFMEMLERIEKGLGKEAISNMHCHVSGIEYGLKGEKNHLQLDESDMKYQELMKSLKDFGCKGVVVCESPNLEGDALLLQKAYNEA